MPEAVGGAILGLIAVAMACRSSARSTDQRRASATVIIGFVSVLLGGLVASVQETAREVGGLHARDAAKGAASLVAKEQSSKGANVEASLANALNALRQAAQGIGGAIEVECRIGVACEKGAGFCAKQNRLPSTSAGAVANESFGCIVIG